MSEVLVEREPFDVSEKVSWPVVVLAVIAVAQAVITDGWNAPETSTLVAAAVTAVVGYFKHETVEV